MDSVNKEEDEEAPCCFIGKTVDEKSREIKQICHECHWVQLKKMIRKPHIKIAKYKFVMICVLFRSCNLQDANLMSRPICVVTRAFERSRNNNY